VVLGDPAYYNRFGFSSDHALRSGDVPPQYFQSVAFTDEQPAGEVSYHPAFGIGA
jgi:putative acetyltransferase